MKPMRASTGVAFLTAVLLAVGALRAEDVTLLDRANAWKPGDPVPVELLHYPPIPESCIQDVPENVAVLFDTTNDALLLAMLSAPCDQKIFGCTVDAAFLRLGASKFLNRLRESHAAHPERFAEKRLQRLYTLTTRRHVTVDCLFIEDASMAAAERDETFAKIFAELRAGARFADVLKKYADLYRYEENGALSDGTRFTLHLTRIGNNGDFILTTNNRRAINRSAEVPASHARSLLAAKPGDVLILPNDAEGRRDLYCVREAYEPPSHATFY